MKFERIKPGMVLYERHKHRMGNTTLRTLGEWSVRIVSIDEHGAMASWNGNAPQRWFRNKLEKMTTWSMHDDCAEVVRGMFDCVVSVKLKKGHRAPEPKAP